MGHNYDANARAWIIAGIKAGALAVDVHRLLGANQALMILSAFKIAQGFDIIQGNTFTFYGNQLTGAEVFKYAREGFRLNR